jgi:hypothetical protein
MSDKPDGLIDDGTIPDEAWLLRRIPRLLCKDDISIESSNFDERQTDLGLSVTLWLTQRDLELTLVGHEDFGIVAVKAEAFRREDGIIVRKPLEENPNHCEIYPRMKNSRCKRIRDSARWVYYPPWFPLENRVPELTL